MFGMIELQEQGATTKLVPSVLQASSVVPVAPEDEMWRMRLGDIWAAALLERDKKKKDEITNIFDRFPRFRNVSIVRKPWSGIFSSILRLEIELVLFCIRVTLYHESD